MNAKNTKNNSLNGQVMMLVIMAMAGVIIGATAISGVLTARQIRQTADAGSLATAVFAADAGLEWRMYKLYEDWKAGNLYNEDTGHISCADCASGVACDKRPQFDGSVTPTITCSVSSGSNQDYLYFQIQSAAKVRDTSYVFQQFIRLIK